MVGWFRSTVRVTGIAPVEIPTGAQVSMLSCVKSLMYRPSVLRFFLNWIYPGSALLCFIGLRTMFVQKA